MPETRIVSVRVRGRVQGIGFRAWVHGQAELRDLDGWVRNRRDGTVEAVLAGAPDAVEAMLIACRQGPRGSTVDDVEVEELEKANLSEPIQPGRFEVLRTA